MTRSAEAKRKRRAITVSLAVALVLTGAKLVTWMITDSVALLSETLHSFTDLIAVMIAFVAVRRATAPPHASYRYGHGRAENLSALLEGVVVIAASFFIVIEAVRALLSNHDVQQPLIATVVMLVAAVVYAGLAWFLRREARALQSPALAADSQHVLTDVYAASGVGVALAVVSVSGYQWLDPAVSFLVAAIVARLGYRLVHEAGRVLLDVAWSETELDELREVLQEPLPGVTGYHRLRSRRAGVNRHLDLHLTFVPNLTLERAHALASEVEGKLHRRFSNLDVVIHLEPDSEAPPLGDDVGLSDILNRVPDDLPAADHYDYERKFLLSAPPDYRRLEALGAQVIEIEQHYLKTAPDIEERVRRRFTSSGESYYWTRKDTRPGLARELEERKIDRAEYDLLLERNDSSRHPIRKTRYSFTLDNKLFEIDSFALPVKMQMLEVEMPSADSELVIPDFIPIEREVTDDPEFLNATISASLGSRKALSRAAWLDSLDAGDPVWVFARSSSSDTAGYGEVAVRLGGRLMVRTRGRDVDFDGDGLSQEGDLDLRLERPGTR